MKLLSALDRFACCVLVTHSIAALCPALADSGSSFASSTSVLKASIVTSPPPSRTLSLSDCFERADKYNKELLSAGWNLSIAKAGVRLAGAIPNPQFQLLEGVGPTFSSEILGQNEIISTTQQILTAGKRSKKIEQARANYGLAAAQLEALRFDVHNRVRRTYAELAAAEAYAELIEAEEAVARNLLAISERRFAAGKAPQTEVLQAKLNVSQFDTQRNQAQIRLQQDSTALALITGETPGMIEVIDVNDNGLFKLSQEKTDIVPSPTGALPPVQKLRAIAFKSRPDWKACEQDCVVAQKALAVARAQRIPDITIGGGYTYAHWAKHQPVELGMAKPNYIGNGAFLTVSFENPIFYQHQGEVQQAAANYRQSERQCDALKCRIAADVDSSYNEVIVARANTFLFQNNLLPTAAEAARIARKGYQVGKTDLATAIVAQQQYQQTLSSYFSVVVSYQNAWADLERAVGVPLRLQRR